MKKALSKILSLILVVSSLQTAIVWADFSDVSTNHKNFEAINTLQQLGIINGYADGTFKPDQSVNRAEFLKIILEGSDIPLDIKKIAPFTDTNNSDWYAPYINKAYSEGWLVGYPDGTARPAQTINKVEALKILAEVQKWELSSVEGEWYTPYVDYAKAHNFLEDSISSVDPGHLMSRADISEIIFRSIEKSQEQEAIDEVDTTITENNPPTFYQNITLDSEFPSTFYVNETYFFEGSVDPDSANKITAILEDEDNSSNRQIFTADMENGDFSLAVNFPQTGNYLLGIFPGNSGTSKAKLIKVTSENPPQQQSETAKIKNVSFENNKTFVAFNADPDTFKKFKFTQNSKTVTYWNRQNISRFPINYNDFKNFNEGSVSLDFSVGDKSDSLNFTATTHQYSSILDGKIDAPEIPEKLSSISDIKFSGTTKTETNLRAYVIKPDGFVESFNLSSNSPTSDYLSNKVLASGSDFNFNYSPSTTGTYIIEINKKDNTAVVNHPIYVGSAIPLLPDYFDLNKRSTFKGNFDLEAMRQDLLDEINKARLAHGLNPVVLSDELNDLAQAHSLDMAEKNYFGHVNLEGQSPEDRRIAAGIKTSVGENLAANIASIKEAHEGLMRSAGHRSNTIDPSWTRVGIGVAEDGSYINVSEEFSITEAKESDLAGFKNELIEEINNVRSDAGLSSIPQNLNLENAAEYINDEVIDNNRSFKEGILQDAVNTFKISGSTQGLSWSHSIWNAILESVIKNSSDVINDTDWQKLGVDLQLDDFGNIHTIILLNN